VIAFRVELWCDGCRIRYEGGAHDAIDTAVLGQLASELIRCVTKAGWTIDGAAHWCPQCTRQRNTAANGKPGSAA
jgi:hypothetical protein